MENNLIPIQNIIYEIRGQRVMIDSDLAKLYQVEVRELNRAVRRNIKRFPDDFIFQLTDEEWKNLKFQFGTSSWGGKRKLPFAFTEQGIAMLSSVLKSEQAIEVNINIMRAFVYMRQYVVLEQSTKDDKLEDLRKMLLLHIENSDNKFSEHDEAINQIARVLNNLIEHPKPKRRIGFITDDDD